MAGRKGHRLSAWWRVTVGITLGAMLLAVAPAHTRAETTDALTRAETRDARPRQLALLQDTNELVQDPAPPSATAVQDSMTAIQGARTQPDTRPLPPPDDGLDEIRYAHRSTTAAVLMTVPFPGWGQFYGESPFWGAVAFSVQMWFYGNILLELRRGERQRVARDGSEPDSAEREFRDALADEHGERARDYVWWAAGSVLLVSLDAYVSVQLVDFDAPNPPTPDLDRGPGSSGGNGGGLALTLQLPF